eukprot:a175828_5.p1 GENE.a175828_5~~a175828_5.p1  ORF type:complete len:563 (-),score=218.18 a175828_5:103-1767(-)
MRMRLSRAVVVPVLAGLAVALFAYAAFKERAPLRPEAEFLARASHVPATATVFDTSAEQGAAARSGAALAFASFGLLLDQGWQAPARMDLRAEFARAAVSVGDNSQAMWRYVQLGMARGWIDAEELAALRARTLKQVLNKEQLNERVPNALTICYALETMALLEPDFATNEPELMDAALDAVLASLRHGGFVDGDGNANLASTLRALNVLWRAEAGPLGARIREALNASVQTFVLDCQLGDGGFGPTRVLNLHDFEARTSSAFSTAQALEILLVYTPRLQWPRLDPAVLARARLFLGSSAIDVAASKPEHWARTTWGTVAVAELRAAVPDFESQMGGWIPWCAVQLGLVCWTAAALVWVHESVLEHLVALFGVHRPLLLVMFLVSGGGFDFWLLVVFAVCEAGFVVVKLWRQLSDEILASVALSHIALATPLLLAVHVLRSTLMASLALPLVSALLSIAATAVVVPLLLLFVYPELLPESLIPGLVAATSFETLVLLAALLTRWDLAFILRNGRMTGMHCAPVAMSAAQTLASVTIGLVMLDRVRAWVLRSKSD